MSRNTNVCAAALIALFVTTSSVAEIPLVNKAVTFGPVVLHEGARFELCANSKFARFDIQAVLGFVRVSDGASVSREAQWLPGEGGCFSLAFEKVGAEPVFGVVGVTGEPSDRDIVASAAIINGFYDAPKPNVVLEDEGERTATVFGPLTIPKGKRVETCAHNWQSEFPANFTVNVLPTKGAGKPLLTEHFELEPGKGGCFAVSAEQARGRSVLIEVMTEPFKPGFSSPLPVIGAFIINGLLDEPLPPDFRYLPEQ